MTLSWGEKKFSNSREIWKGEGIDPWAFFFWPQCIYIYIYISTQKLMTVDHID
jgi:hypothetical protein